MAGSGLRHSTSELAGSSCPLACPCRSTEHIPRDRQVYFFNLDNQRTSSTVPAVAGLHVQIPDVEHPSTPTPPVVAVTEPAGSGTAHAVSNVRNMSVREYLAVSGQANLSLARGNTSQASGRPVTTRISAFDSHFHLDQSLVKLVMPYYSDIRTILDADVGIRPQVEVDVVGGVLIYCDPEPNQQILGGYRRKF
ncbi:hypothetical protein DPMN_075496 [Dreissena polymorpha]|uniref:Uncharacterized protein n=1 Tax=Dreissena polymorpha TaxID=45954 RepID=A0A9D4BPG6_DREPO|nr:hypothetical protein DPMN_075496 [Dreissena polymorpha]